MDDIERQGEIERTEAIERHENLERRDSDDETLNQSIQSPRRPNYVDKSIISDKVDPEPNTSPVGFWSRDLDVIRLVIFKKWGITSKLTQTSTNTDPCLSSVH